MKFNAKKIFVCSALFAASTFAFGVETGGLLTNETKLANTPTSDKSLKLNQKNGANLWLRTPLSQDGSSYFATEGSFTTEYNAAASESDKKLKLTLDLNLFKLVAKKSLRSGNITFSAGRFFNSDLTQTVYAQNGDGIKLEGRLSHFQFSVFGAYTGLLNAKNVTILEDKRPQIDGKEKTLYVLANKYAVGALTFSLPHIVLGQTISLEGIGAFSLESEAKENRFYGTLALNGPIVSPVFYNVSSTLSFDKVDGKDMQKGNLSKASISIYPAYKSMSISINGVYASGEQGSFSSFKGFTSRTAVNDLAQREYTAIAKAGLGASIKPVSNLLLKANGDVVLDAKKDIEMAGFVYSAGIDWQVVSDVSAGVSFGQYIGKENSDNNKTELKITAAIAF